MKTDSDLKEACSMNCSGAAPRVGMTTIAMEVAPATG